MGKWIQVTTDDERRRYNELLVGSYPAYESANLKGLNRLLGERGGRAFLYAESETGDSSFHILLLMTPDPIENGVWKIVNAVPTGEFEPVEAATITYKKIRDLMDEWGVQSWYGTPQKDYGHSGINQYFAVVPDLFWELTSIEEATNDRFRYTFYRSPERRGEDEDFKGPGATGLDVGPSTGKA
ncbi:MAG: hypothetical protein R3C02_18730 [Planctomycetaceae bacterium]|nr:hypothetical protein [Planctomycetaceae bacterium]